MEIAQIRVNGTNCESMYLKRIPAGASGLKVRIDFDEHSWGSLKKTAVFRGCVTRDVLDPEGEVLVPAEVIAEPGENLYIGMYGVNADGNTVIPTVWANLGEILEAADPSGDESTDPVLPVWAQLQADCAQQREQIESNKNAIADLRQNSGVTAENIKAALGYIPADAEAVSALQMALVGVSDLIGGEV